jgi:hypothetical protein
MKKLLLLLVLSFGIMSIQAQPKDGKLIADETWYVESGKTAFRIVTANDVIRKKFMDKYSAKMTKFTYIQKKDRKGGYWESSFYFKNEDYNTIVSFVNNGFK